MVPDAAKAGHPSTIHMSGDEPHTVRSPRWARIHRILESTCTAAEGDHLKNRLLFGSMAFVLFLVAACNGSGDDEDATPPPASTSASQSTELTELEANYLVQVSGAFSLFATKAASFQAVFAQTWPTNQLLFDALRDAGAGTAWVVPLEAVQELEPPRRFEADHSALLTRLEEVVRIDAEIGETLESGDLNRFVLLNAELGVVANVNNLAIDPAICEAIAPPGPQIPLCRSAEDLAGGDYGSEVEVLFLEFEANLGPRLGVWGGWRPLASDAQFFEVLETVQPEIAASIQEALDRLTALTPPAELEADHVLLSTHLNSLLEFSGRAAAAIDAQDVEAYDAEFMAALPTVCNTRSALSPDMQLIAHGHFDPPRCP